jgi:hypothetical protein
VGSDQVFPKAFEAELALLSDGRIVAAQLAGRDPAANVVALRFEKRRGER